MAVDWAAVIRAATVALRDMMKFQCDNGLLFVIARMQVTVAVQKKVILIAMPLAYHPCSRRLRFLKCCSSTDAYRIDDADFCVLSILRNSVDQAIGIIIRVWSTSNSVRSRNTV